MRPHTSYLICCNPRTGSWLLAEGLQFTDIAGRPREFFAREHEQEWIERLGATTYVDYLDKVIEYATTPNGIFGAKVHWYQFQQFSSRLRQVPEYAKVEMPNLLSSLFPNLQYIWLSRHDKVRQAVSYYKAAQTGRFWRIGGIEHDEAKDPTFDFKAIDRLRQKFIANEAAWRQYFHQSGIKPIVVFYDELAEAYEATIRRLLCSLQIPLPKDLVITEPRLNKQADLVSEELVQRYRAYEEAQEAGNPCC